MVRERCPAPGGRLNAGLVGASSKGIGCDVAAREGGYDDVGMLSDGKLYKPETDTWTDVNPVGAPSARTMATAVYTWQ